MLYFIVVQDAPNAVGQSPLGSCPGDPACPVIDATHAESYYGCPPQGCVDYVIQLNDGQYVPAESNCSPYPQFEQNEPTSSYKLVGRGAKKSDSPSTFDTFENACKFSGGKDGKFPHYQLTRKVDGKLLQCKATTGPDDIQLVDAATVVTGPVDGNPMSDGGPVGGPVDGGSVGGGPTDGGQVDVPTSDTGG